MSQSKAASIASLRLMNLVGALRALPSLPIPGAVEQWVLDGLATIRAPGTRATAREAQRSSPGALPSTNLRRPEELQLMGLIVPRADQNAGCVRIVVPAGAGDAGPAGLGR